MIAQSLAIVALILVMCFMFLRANKAAWALLALPLISVPLFYLLGVAVFYAAGGEFSRAAYTSTGAGLVLGVSCCALLSGRFPSKKLRLTYLAGCTLFSVALAIAYANYLL